VNHYYAAIIPDEKQYAVFFPDVPGCLTCGNTLDEAFGYAIEALAGHLEALVDDGDPVPAPSEYAEALRKAIADVESFGDTWPEGAILQMVPAPELDVSPKRVSVSFKRYTLEMIDRKAEAAGMTRSGFLAAAANAFTPALD
jgi:predicted RNase H-like HicB family nuclease